MSEIIVTGQDVEEKVEQPEGNQELKYQFTEVDEERFFLMYHMNIQPSEVESLHEDYRRALIARFLHQKKAEQEMMQRQQLMQQLNRNGGPGGPSNLIR